MRLYLGPVAPGCVRAWTKWARGVLDDVRDDPAAEVCLSSRVLDDVEDYVGEWERRSARRSDTFRWHTDAGPEDLDYLANALRNLDLRLAANGEEHGDCALPPDGRVFHLVLVRALLSALALEGPTYAAFAEQMRASWPIAVEAL